MRPCLYFGVRLYPFTNESFFSRAVAKKRKKEREGKKDKERKKERERNNDKRKKARKKENNHKVGKGWNVSLGRVHP